MHITHQRPRQRRVLFLAAGKNASLPIFWRAYQGSGPVVRTVTLEAASSGPGCCKRPWMLRDQFGFRNLNSGQYDGTRRRLEPLYSPEGSARFFEIDVHLYVPKQP